MLGWDEVIHLWRVRTLMPAMKLSGYSITPVSDSAGCAKSASWRDNQGEAQPKQRGKQLEKNVACSARLCLFAEDVNKIII